MSSHEDNAAAAEDRDLDIDPAQPYVLTLRSPLVFKHQRIETLTIQPVRAKHLRNLPTDNPFDTTLTLMARLAEQPAAIIDELRGEDLATAMAVTTVFFQATQVIGKTR